jgi:hypothetical protein
MGILGGITNTFQNLEEFFSALLDPHTYVRLFFVVLGFSLIIGSVMYGQ